MLPPSLFATFGVAAIMLLDRLKTGNNTMKNRINELKAAHARITNHADAVRLSNEIGIAMLEAFCDHIEETKARDRLNDIANQRNIRERKDTHDALVREVEEREDAKDAMMAEMVRLLRKLAGEPEPSEGSDGTASEDTRGDSDECSLTARAREVLRGLVKFERDLLHNRVLGIASASVAGEYSAVLYSRGRITLQKAECITEYGDGEPTALGREVDRLATEAGLFDEPPASEVAEPPSSPTAEDACASAAPRDGQ